MSDAASQTARIERDLDQTRSRLDGRLSALQGRLSPGQVLDDLMGYFRGSEGAEFGRSLLDNVRGNPMPAAITTIGLAWLMVSKPRASEPAHPGAAPPSARLPIFGHDDHDAVAGRLGAARQSVVRVADERDDDYLARLDHAHGEALGLARHSEETRESFSRRVRNTLGEIEDAIAGKGRALGGQAGDALSAAGAAVGSLGGSAQGAARDAATYVGDKLSSGSGAAGRAGGDLIAAISESPVILGALGMAAGALLGALLPHSDQEEAALGGVAGQLRGAVRDLVDKGSDAGGRVAQAVADEARGSVQAHGFDGDRSAGQLLDEALGGSLAADARQVAGDVMRAADEAVRKEGLAGDPEGA